MMDLRGQNGPSLAFEMESDGDDIEQNCVNDLPDPKECIISLYTKKKYAFLGHLKICISFYSKKSSFIYFLYPKIAEN